MSVPSQDWMIGYLRPLIGYTVVDVQPTFGGCVNLVLQAPGTKEQPGRFITATLLSDTEGNGPGFLQLSPCFRVLPGRT